MRIFFFTKVICFCFKYFFFGYKRYAQLLLLVLLKKPKSILEIGVYTGKRSKEMLMAANVFSNNIEFYGFDLFENFKDKILKEEFSKKPLKKKFIESKLAKYGKINLYKGFTYKTLPKFIKRNKKIDFIFIDGGHSIKTINNDWSYVKKVMHKKTIVIFDDYYNDKKFTKKFGCNKLINSLDKNKYEIKIFSAADSFFIQNKKISNNIVRINLK